MEHILLPALDWSTGTVATREMLEVEREGTNFFRLLHSPAFVDGIARGDLLELLPDIVEGYRIIERGGYLAIVVAFPDAEAKSKSHQLLIESLVPVAGVCEGGPSHSLVCSVPVTAGFPNVEAILNSFCHEAPGTTWWFGNVYSLSGEPLGWW